MDLDYSFDFDLLDFDLIHGWLTGTYWSPGITRERVERGFRASSVVIGCYTTKGLQIGCGRCLSDSTRFAYFSDVFVAPEWRGKGIARAMVQRLMAHPEVTGVDCMYLQTQDAHGVYAELGFEKYPFPERLMYRPQTL